MQTQEKIEESKFFLDRMKEHYNDNRKFRYYFSAFLSSSRSILWFLQYEYSDHPAFKKWYEAKKPSPEMESIFKDINNMRVETIHKKPIDTRRIVFAEYSLPVDFDYKEMLDKKYLIDISKADTEGIQTATFTGDTGQTFTGMISDYKIVNTLDKPDDLYHLSDAYLEAVAGIYNEWLEYRHNTMR